MDFKQAQAQVQKFGAFLSAMVMPNIGVFLGWGVLTAFFIETGWCPNEYLAKLVSPILTYLLPCLIGYTAGMNLYGRRGGVIGAFATVGVVVGSNVTMLVGGMVMGPIAAWLLKKFDQVVEGHVKTGLEMLVDNFSLGLIGIALCVLGYVGVAPVMMTVQNFLAGGVNYMTEEHLIPLAALFVQPAQILFLNNAINHGIMVPLGLQQTAELGKSVLFLVEANGAIWVGLAAAFAVFGTGIAKKTAPGAVVIMFLGGIAEVCFPYCLMMPITIIGPIVGNMFSLFMLTMFDGGAVGPPSPGSVFAFYLMTPKSSMLINTIAYFGSMAITFVVTSAILKFGKQPGSEKDEELSETTLTPAVAGTASPILTGNINKVIFACDAGMGSSAMGVSILKDKLKKAGLSPEIVHVAVSDIPSDADVVVTNENLAKRAVKVTGGKVPILTLANFMDQQEYDRIVSQITNGTQEFPNKLPIFGKANIVLGAKFSSKREAIAACGDIFIQRGYTDPQYKEDMFERDKDVSVYLGNGVAMPHGLNSSKKSIRNSGICFIQVPEGVDFDGNMAYLLIGVAGNEEEHVDILGKIGMALTTGDNNERLRTANNKQEVLDILKF